MLLSGICALQAKIKAFLLKQSVWKIEEDNWLEVNLKVRKDYNYRTELYWVMEPEHCIY